MVEMEGFLAWLGEKGFSPEQLAGFRGLATELGAHADVDAAVQAAEAAGAPPKRIANLKTVAARIAEYEASRATPSASAGAIDRRDHDVRASGSGESALAVEIDPRDRGALERASAEAPRGVEAVPHVHGATSEPALAVDIDPRDRGALAREPAGAAEDIDVRARGALEPAPGEAAFDIDTRDRGALQRGPAASPGVEAAVPARPAPRVALRRDHVSPRLGCECRERKDVYLDTDFGALASMIGGGVGIGTLILIRFFGVLGAAAIALGLAAAGGAATIISICFRCEGCRRTVRDLDDDEKAHLRKGRGKVTLVTLGFLAGAALCSFLWWRAVTADLRDQTIPTMVPTEQAHPAADDPHGGEAADEN